MQPTWARPSPSSRSCSRWELGVSVSNKFQTFASASHHARFHIGAVRTFDSRMTAFDLAIQAQNSGLCSVLRPIYEFDVSEHVMRQIAASFHGLICHDMGWSGDLKLPELDVLREGTGDGWFPVLPGVSIEVQSSEIFLASIRWASEDHYLVCKDKDLTKFCQYLGILLSSIPNSITCLASRRSWLLAGAEKGHHPGNFRSTSGRLRLRFTALEPRRSWPKCDHNVEQYECNVKQYACSSEHCKHDVEQYECII